MATTNPCPPQVYLRAVDHVIGKLQRDLFSGDGAGDDAAVLSQLLVVTTSCFLPCLRCSRWGFSRVCKDFLLFVSYQLWESKLRLREAAALLGLCWVGEKSEFNVQHASSIGSVCSLFFFFV